MCRWGWILGEMGYGRACMMLWCHGWGWNPPLTASHIHIGCIQSGLAPWDAVDGHMCAPLHCYARMGGGVFWENWSMAKSKWCCGVMVEAPNHKTLHLSTTRHIGEGWNFGMAEPGWCCTKVESPNPIDCIPQPYHLYTKCFRTLISCGWAYGCLTCKYTTLCQ